MEELAQAKWLVQALSAALKELQKDWHHGLRSSQVVSRLYNEVENAIISAELDVSDLVDELEEKQHLASLTCAGADSAPPCCDHCQGVDGMMMSDGEEYKCPVCRKAQKPAEQHS